MQPRQFAQPRAGMLQPDAHAQPAPQPRWPRAARAAAAPRLRPRRSTACAAACGAACRRCCTSAMKPSLASEAAATLTQRGRPSWPMACSARSSADQVGLVDQPAAHRHGQPVRGRLEGAIGLQLQLHRTIQVQQLAPVRRASRTRPAAHGRSAARRPAAPASRLRPAPVHRPTGRAPCTAAKLPRSSACASAPSASDMAAAALQGSGSSAPPITRSASRSTVASAARSASSSERALSSAMPDAGRYSAKSEPFRRPVSAPCTWRG